jgi:predicted AAA+ superfamily ATPase
MKNFIPRPLYMKKIAPFMNKGVIKVIIGQRRVGKSYFMYQIIDALKEENPRANIIYLNKELYEFDHIKNYRHLVQHVKKHQSSNGRNHILIDEVQDIDQFEKALRHFQAEGGYDVYCTGSNAKMLSGDLATYLSGRYVAMKIFSLSYPEFLNFHNLKNTAESFLQYVKYGGLPYLFNLPMEDNVVYDYLRNVYNTILLKDIVKRHRIRNVAFLESLVKYLADNTGSNLSAKRISDFLKSQKVKISPNVILNYLTYLASAFFIFKVPRAEISGGKIFEVGDKYYFEDLGLRHVILPYQQKDINKVLENLVYNHLAISGYDLTIGKTGNKEIDFVCTRNGEKLYVQVAYLIPDNRVWEREFSTLLAIKDNYPKMVVSMDEAIGKQYQGINHIHIREFLSEYR